MKTKFLPITLLLLVLLNAILIFILLKKPKENQPKPKGKEFLMAQLNFSEEQKGAFLVLDENHKRNMIPIENEIKVKKDILFQSLKDSTINTEIILEDLGDLSAKREKEILNFFTSVRKLCTKKQVGKFDEIIEKALKNGPHRPPHDRRPPPREGVDIPPPRDF